MKELCAGLHNFLKPHPLLLTQNFADEPAVIGPKLVCFDRVGAKTAVFMGCAKKLDLGHWTAPPEKKSKDTSR